MLSNPLLSFIPAIEKGLIGNGFDWGQASMVTICGLVIVFSMLVLLVVVISVFGAIMDKVNGVKKEKTVKKKTPVAPVVTAAPVVTVAEDNDEIIAVIAAAVDAIYADTGVKPVIRRIKPSATKGKRSAWATVGVFENTQAF